MSQVTCNDCGVTYDSNLPSCPECGCPTSKNATAPSESSTLTTDTGYTNEHLIMKLAEVAYWSIIIAGVIAIFVLLACAAVFGGASAFLIGLLVGFPLYLLNFWFARIVRAFFMLYANISVNLHEINMKIK